MICSLIVGCGVNSSVPVNAVESAALADIDAGFGEGFVWRVGPKRDYKTPSAVADRVNDGDVVLIDAATYECDGGVVWRANRLTLKGVGGRPHLKAANCNIGGKGIWAPAGIDLLIDNIEFSGANVGHKNGAGIRFEGGGQVIIRNSYFHSSQNGILFTPAPGFETSTDLLIEHSEFAFNGTKSGQAHNLYINGARSFTFRYNYSHSSQVGHLVKSRARNNYILHNRLMTMGGTGSYEIDLPAGGDAWVAGNIIQQGSKSQNRGLISFGTEASKFPEQSFFDGHIYVTNNTFINDNTRGADLLVLNGYDFAEARFANNLLVNIPESTVDQLEGLSVSFQDNLVTGDPGFQDRIRHNYALNEDAEAIDAGGDPGKDHLGQPLAVTQSYRHPTGAEPRRTTGEAFDIGALEYHEGSADSPTLKLEAEAITVDYGADAELSWTTTGAERCSAREEWEGTMDVTGAASIGPLHQPARFALYCDGPGGTVRANLEITVGEHPLAASYPDYRFIEMADTSVLPLCQTGYPYRGVGGCTARPVSAAYVPEQNAYYLFGGGHRAYYGNEVIRLDLDEREVALVFGPSDPRNTKNFNPGHEGAWDMIADCRGVWDLQDGGAVPAPANVYTSWIYAPPAKKILKNGGQVACGGSTFDSDSWWFDPYVQDWRIRQREGVIGPGGSHAVYDPDTEQLLIFGDQAIHRFDPKTEDIVELGPYNDRPWANTPVLDPVNDVIILIGNGNWQQQKFTVIDIRGVDENATSLPPQTQWTAKGDLSFLEVNGPALAYDEDRNVVVGWGGGSKLHFLAVDREKREVEIIARTLDETPRFEYPKHNTFLYAKKEKAFIAYAGADSNFYLLKAED